MPYLFLDGLCTCLQKKIYIFKKSINHSASDIYLSGTSGADEANEYLSQ